MIEKGPIVFFDGLCPLCRTFIHFLLKADREGKFFVAPLQGETARRLLAEEEVRNLRTIVFYENGERQIRSDAALEVFRRLGFPYKAIALFSFLPKPFRDGVYKKIAKYRYRIFGKRESAQFDGENNTRILK